MPPKSARAPPPPPVAPTSPSPPPRSPPPPSPFVTEAHVLRATQTVFGSAPDARGVAPSWSDASWLCVSDVPTLDGDETPGAASDRDTAWAQVGPWGAFALVSAFRLETRVWNALRFEARASRPEFRVGWDLVETSEEAYEAYEATEETPLRSSTTPIENTDQEDLSSVASFSPPDAPLAATTTRNDDATRRREKKKKKKRRSLSSSPERRLVSSTNASETYAASEEEEDASKRSVSENGWYEPWITTSTTSTTSPSSFDPSAWREVFVPLDRTPFFDHLPDAAAAEPPPPPPRGTAPSWNRLSWRDVSGFGGEIQLRDVRLESWERLDVGRTNAADVETASLDGAEASARNARDTYASAPPAPPAPAAPTIANAYASVPSREMETEPVAVTVPDGATRPQTANGLDRLLLVAFFVSAVALAFVAACAAALLSRRFKLAAKERRAIKKEKDEERGAAMDPSAYRRDGNTTREYDAYDAAVSPYGLTVSSARPSRTRASRAARRPPLGPPRRAASESDADAAFASRRDRRRDAIEVGDLGAFARSAKVETEKERKPSTVSDSGTRSECVSRTPTKCSAGDSSTGGDFGGVLRGADQPGVVSLTADALALALETTAEAVSAASSTPTSTRCDDDDETADGFSSSSETFSFSDGASERGVSFARVPELTASQFQTQIELDAVLGRGASAVVRAGTWTRRVDDDTKTSDFRVSTVAVKLFAAEGDASADDKTKENAISFERELRALRMVGSRHARVVALIAACHSPRAFLMPLLDGGSLHDALLDANECDDPYGVFPLTHRLRLLTHVASALRYLHACDKPVVFGSGASSEFRQKRLCSIAHLDVKPKNVLLDASTRGAKLADFGTARLVFSRGSLARDENTSSDALSASSDDERVVDAAVDAMVDETETFPLHARSIDEKTTMSAPPGTINYMAPELFDDVVGDFASGAGDATRSLLRCDAWSFAMTAFETVTGSIPWRGLTPTQIVELVGVKDERPRWGDLERRDWLGREESVSGEDGKENRRVDRRVAAVTARRVASRVEKCWARDPLSRPPFAETLAALRRLRRGLERGLPGSANDEEDERKRKRREDADPRVAPRGASFASALELSSASE